MTDERDPAADTKHFTAYEAVAAIEELTEETGGCADMDEYTAIVQRAIDASHAPSPGLQEAARQAAVECAQFATVWFDKPIVPGFGVTGTRQLAAILTRKFAPLVERLEQLEEDNAEYIKTIGALRAQRDRLDKMYADERDDLKAKLEQAEAALALYKVPKSTSLSGQGADGLKAKLATAEKEIAHLRDRTRCHEYVCSRCGNVWAEESGRQTAAKCHRCGWIVRCPRCQPPELRALKAKLLAAEKDAKRLREALRLHKHTAECLHYAAKTSRASNGIYNCIAKCADSHRQALAGNAENEEAE